MIAQDLPPKMQPGLQDIADASTSERQVWQAALFLIREHGADAADIADHEAMKYRRGPDQLSYMVWTWISRVTADLIRCDPDPGEYRH